MTLTETRSAAGDDASRVRLDNLTLARKEGWRRFVNSPARIAPEPLTRAELGALGEEAVEDYNRRRREWHANLGPIKTPQLAALHGDLWDIVDSNAQDGDKAKGAVAVDAFPGLGKPRRCWRSPANTTAARSTHWVIPRSPVTNAGRCAGWV